MAYVRTQRRRGLGAYPGDCYYDPNRPWWVPGFIDTPTESQAKLACLYGVTGNVTATEILNPSSVYKPPPTPVLPGAPSGTAVPSATNDFANLPSTLIDTAEAQTQAQNQDFFNNLANQLGVNPNPPGGGLSLTTILTIGLVAGLGLILATSGGGGRRRR